ncbi:MAG: hypothetical protein COB15_16845, partial [Flavobacteriales bacterium]
MKLLLKYTSIILLFAFSTTYAHEDNKTIKFVENKGQWPKQVNFKSDVAGGKIWIENNKISYQ